MAYGPHADQCADVYRGDVDRPLVVLVHGGYWRPAFDRIHLRPAAHALASAGYTVALIEYRRVPGDPEASVTDVADAVSRLPERVSPHDGRIVLAGHSAGGHLALCVASAGITGLTSVVALAPIADLTWTHELGFDDDAAAAFVGTHDPADFDPLLLPSPRVPVTILHGARDSLVPIEQSQRYATVHPEARLVTIEQAAHFELIDPTHDAWGLVRQALP